MSAPKGYSSQGKEDRLQAQFATVEPVRAQQNALSVLSHEFVYEVGTDAVEAGSTVSAIVATAHAAKKGDVIRFTSGTLSGQEVKVWDVSANLITLAENLPSAPAAAVTFQILRHKYPTVTSDGSVNVSATIVEAAVAADGGALPALTKVVSGYDGSAVQVLKTDADGELQVDVKSIAGFIDTANGSTTPLAGGGVFTGSWVQITDYASIHVGVYADQNSATNGLQVEFSEDGTNVHHTHSFTFSASSGGVGYLFQPEFKYYRVKYTNGATLQATFKLISTLRAVAIPPSMYPANYTFTGQSQVQLTKGVIVGESSGGGGSYVAVKVNPSGALVTEAEVSYSVLPLGAATEATLAALDAKVTACNTGSVTIASSALPTGAATESTLSTLNGKVTACNTGAVTISSSALPTGAATESTLSTLNGKVTACNTGAVTISTALPTGSNTIGKVDIASALPAGTNTIGAVTINTLSVVDLLDANILDTSSTNIAGSSSSPTQVVASLAANVKALQILDTTGAFIGLYTGAAASEVLKLVIGPGSDQTIEHTIASGTRITLRRLDSTTAISSGIVAINFLG